MTPLYRRLAKRLTLPEKKREPLYDPHELLTDLGDVHCFDCTSITLLIEEIADMEWNERQLKGKGALSKDLLFLPAPRTWVEQRLGNDARFALFADRGSTNVLLSMIVPPRREGDPFKAFRVRSRNGDYHEDEVRDALGDFLSKQPGVLAPAASTWIQFVATLAIINSPKVVHRVEHASHKSIARQVTQREGKAFKVHPYHEIKLEVFKPRHIDDGEAHSDVITGRRALHFCRAFVRVRLGRLERVQSHWRGDPALGIHQASYRVTR